MKRHMIWIAVAVLGVSAVLAFGSGNTATVLRANIPFDFALADQAYPPGEYYVMFPFNSSDGLIAFGTSLSAMDRILLAGGNSSTVNGEKPSFDFRLYKYRDSSGEVQKAYFFFRVNAGYGMRGRELPMADAERTIEREAKAHPLITANGERAPWRPEIVSLPASR